MFPLIALGAALLGGFATYEIESNQDSKGSRSSHRAHDSAQASAVSPQSYIVTPIASNGDQASNHGNAMSAVDAVQKLVF